MVLRREIEDARELDEDEECERDGEEEGVAREVAPPTEHKDTTKPRLRKQKNDS